MNNFIYDIPVKVYFGENQLGHLGEELSGIAPNPRIDSVRQGAKMCKEHGIDVLLAVGGGSTLDATKWMAAGACVEHDPWDFFNKWAPAGSSVTLRHRIRSGDWQIRCFPGYRSLIRR